MNLFKTIIKWVAAIAIICAAAVFLANINGLSVSRTIATVGENEITEAEYKYYLEMVKQQMISEAGQDAGEDFWKSEIDGKKASDVAKERAMDEAVRTTIAVVKANELGLSLTSDELSAARSVINADDAATKEQVKTLEKSTGADKYMLADIIEKAYMSNKYYQSVAMQDDSPIKAEDEEVKAYSEEKFAVVKHVLIANAPQASQEGEEAVDSEQYAKDAKAKADEVLKKAVDGDNFEKLIADYGEDPGMETNPDGYIIDETGANIDGSGSMIPEFTKGTFKVKAGEVNPELVESSYGWHIIKRYSLPKDGENAELIKSQATSIAMSEKYNEHLDSFKDSLNIVIKDKIYNKIKVK